MYKLVHVSTSTRLAGGIGYVLLLVSQIAGIALSGAAMMQNVVMPNPTLTGKVLMLAPLSTIAMILVGIGWIILGRAVRSGVLIATGVFFIILTIATILTVMYALNISGIFMKKLIMGGVAHQGEILGVLTQIAIMSLATGVVFFITMILHIISHFVAGSRTGVSLFKIAGILHMITFILYIGTIGFTVYYIMTHGPMLGPLALAASPVLGTVAILGLISGVLYIVAITLSAISFFMIRTSRV